MSGDIARARASAMPKMPRRRTALLMADTRLPQLLTEAASGERGEFSLKNLSAHSVRNRVERETAQNKTQKKHACVHCVLLPAAGILPESQTCMLAR